VGKGVNVHSVLLVANLSPRKPRFDPGPVRVRFAVVELTLVPVLALVLRFFPLSVSSHHGSYQSDQRGKPRKFTEDRRCLARLRASDRNVGPHTLSRDYRTLAVHCVTLSISLYWGTRVV